MNDDSSRIPSGRPLERQHEVRATGGLLIGTVALHGAVALFSFAGLPSRIPIHFDANGLPNGFAPPTPGTWFLLTLISLGLALLVTFAAALVPRLPPALMNLPRKADYLTLSGPARERVLACFGVHFLLFGEAMLLTLLTLQVLISLAAHGMIERLPLWPLLSVLLLSFAQIVHLVVRVSAAVESELAARRRDAASPSGPV